jgi:magnesium transporter
MVRLFHRVTKKPALAPGTVVFVGERKVENTEITVIDYDESGLEVTRPDTAEECFPCRDSARTSWINVDGLHNTDLLKRFGEHFGVHPLVLEDIVNTNQRPKIEDYGEHLYIVVKTLSLEEGTHRLAVEQISIILGPGYVLSFQERPGDIFAPVRERLRAGKGRIRQAGADYLAYALLDAVVDHYFIILEAIAEHIESLEEDLVQRPSPDLLRHLHEMKREIIILRRSVWPLRELIGRMERIENHLIGKETQIFLRDVYDHTFQVIESVESFRDMLASFQDLYLSSISNRMNEVMKVLTIIATVFIPLSFLAGVFGMNFDFMPELHWRWSYPTFWLAIIVLAGSMFAYFRKKGWI